MLFEWLLLTENPLCWAPYLYCLFKSTHNTAGFANEDTKPLRGCSRSQSSCVWNQHYNPHFADSNGLALSFTLSPSSNLFTTEMQWCTKWSSAIECTTRQYHLLNYNWPRIKSLFSIKEPKVTSTLVEGSLLKENVIPTKAWGEREVYWVRCQNAWSQFSKWCASYVCQVTSVVSYSFRPYGL